MNSNTFKTLKPYSKYTAIHISFAHFHSVQQCVLSIKISYVNFNVKFTLQKRGPEGIQDIQYSGNERIKTYEAGAVSNDFMFTPSFKETMLTCLKVIRVRGTQTEKHLHRYYDYIFGDKSNVTITDRSPSYQSSKL